MVTGPGSVLGDALIDDDRCSFVAITGETVTGRHVAQRAAAKLKPYSLEMGGKNPLIILSDADMEYAVKSTIFAAYLHQGEICMSADRIIVEKPIVEAFSGALANFVSHLPCGDPADPNTFIGPVISDKQIQKIDGHVKDAVAKGAQLLTGGTYEGRIYQPTVLANITPDMKIYYEETFGPVASIIPVNDEKEALQVANDTMYGPVRRRHHQGPGKGPVPGRGSGRGDGPHQRRLHRRRRLLPLRRVQVQRDRPGRRPVLGGGDDRGEVADYPEDRAALAVLKKLRIAKQKNGGDRCRKKKVKPITNMKTMPPTWPIIAFRRPTTWWARR